MHRSQRSAPTLALVLLAALILLAGCGAASAPASAGVVNIYSARHYNTMEQVFARFTAETGITVRLSQGSVQSLVERLRAEGDQTPADILFSIDAGSLATAADLGLLQPVDSAVLRDTIPAELRDPQNRWFGLTQRARVIVYNPAAVNPTDLSTYASLGDPRWRGRLCLRPGSHIYTQALVASFIAKYGVEATEAQFVRPWVANEPQFIDSDARILETIAAGGCDVGITNHYYVAQQLSRDPNFPVRIFWPDQQDAGAHVNISGMGVTAAAPNRANAIALLEWLAREGKGQGAAADTLTGGNFEFPANPAAELHPLVAGFGSFKADPLNKAEYGRFQAEAIKLLERAGYR